IMHPSTADVSSRARRFGLLSSSASNRNCQTSESSSGTASLEQNLFVLVETIDISALVEFANKTIVDIVFDVGVAKLINAQSRLTVEQDLCVSQSLNRRVWLGRKIPRVIKKFLHLRIVDVVVLRQGAVKSLFVLFYDCDCVHHGFDEPAGSF